jgi:hypothetical protein
VLHVPFGEQLVRNIVAGEEDVLESKDIHHEERAVLVVPCLETLVGMLSRDIPDAANEWQTYRVSLVSSS